MRRFESGRSTRAVVRVVERYALVLCLGAVLLLSGVFLPGRYLTTANIQNILNSQAVLVMLAMAVMIPLIVGELDLSVAAVMGLASVLTGWLNVVHGVPVALAVLAAILLGVGVGVLNGTLVVRGGIDSIVVTLGTGTLATGISYAISSLPISNVSDNLTTAFAFKPLLGLRSLFWMAVISAVVAWYVLGYTPVGRRMYFVGASRDASRLAGIPVSAYRFYSLVAAGAAASVVGVANTGLIGATDPSVGPSYLLPAFSAVFLGATAFVPGRFNVWGAFAAVYFLVAGITALQIGGLSGWIEQVFYGGALLIAVSVARLAAVRGAERDAATDTRGPATPVEARANSNSSDSDRKEALRPVPWVGS